MNKIEHILPLILLVFCLEFGFFHLQAQSQTVSPKIVIGETVTISSQFEKAPVVEPHLSAHPNNVNHLLAAAMVVTDINSPYESSRLSSFVSKDGGGSWKESVHDYWGYDPWTAILPNGQTAMSWLGTQGSFQHQFPIQFFKSDNGGESWLPHMQKISFPHGHDGTKITALDEDFYFTTVRFNDDMSADVVLYHRKGRSDFKEMTKVSGQGVRLNFCEPVILNDGSVLIPTSHYMRKIWVQRYDPLSGTLSEKYLVSINPGGHRGYMRMTADTHITSPFNGQVYFVRASNGVWLNYSRDDGKSWSKDMRIDLFENQKPSQAMVASSAVNQDGIIGISWVDSQHDNLQQNYDLYFAISSDGGQTFSLATRVTKTSFNPRTAGNGDAANKFPGGGHYLSIAAKANGDFQLIWSDSRSGVFELQTCSISIK